MTTKIPIKKIPIFIFAGILLISMIGMIVFGFRKQGYHVDELYSYGLSNSEYLPFMHFGESGYDVADWMHDYGCGSDIIEFAGNLIKDFKILKANNFDFKSSEIYRNYLIAQANSSDTTTTTWVSGQDFSDYLTAGDGTRFNLFSVYYNQRGDVHPPLFYLFLNFTCSLFPGQFSKWFGIVNNMIFMLATLIVLFFTCKKHLKNDTCTLLMCAVFGFSGACMSTVVFLRMYALFTFWIVLCLKVHLDLADNDYSLKGLRAGLVISVLFGYMTHYYFVIYIICLAIITGIVMLIKKKWKNALSYILTLAITGIGGICIWPFSIKHVFLSYRGTGTLSSLSSGFYFIKVRLVWESVCELMFDGLSYLPLILIAAGLLSLLIPVFMKKDCATECDMKSKIIAPVIKLLMVFFPAIVYLLIVSQIVPYYTDRYFMPIFPIIMFAVLGSIFLIVHNFSYLAEKYLTGKNISRTSEKFRSRFVFIGDLIGAALLFLTCTFFIHGSGYLYAGGQETAIVPEHTACVYVLPDNSWNASNADLNVLAQCDDVAVVYESNIDVLSGTVLSDGTTLMITVQNGLDENSVVDKVKEACGAVSYEEYMRSSGTECTRIYFHEN